MYHCPGPSARALRGFLENKKAAGNYCPQPLVWRKIRLALRGGGVLAIQFRTQTIKVRIEGNETGQALEKRGAASFMRNAIQRTLTVTRRQKTVTGQTYRGRIERIDRDVAPLRFFDRAIDVERLPCARRVEAAGNVQPVGNKQYRIWAFPA